MPVAIVHIWFIVKVLCLLLGKDPMEDLVTDHLTVNQCVKLFQVYKVNRIILEFYTIEYGYYKNTVKVY